LFIDQLIRLLCMFNLLLWVPYADPMPVDWNYTTVSAPAAIVEGKINVHLVPHTHDDTGWQVTVDQYFFTDVYYVLDTIVPRLAEDPARRFIYVEIGFFARWWDVQTRAKQDLTRTLVSEGRLEFINGGWCSESLAAPCCCFLLSRSWFLNVDGSAAVHDEASPFYVEMIDQTTRGHQFLRKNFGDTAIPKGTWQVCGCIRAACMLFFLSANFCWCRSTHSAIPTRRRGYLVPRLASTPCTGAALITRTSSCARAPLARRTTTGSSGFGAARPPSAPKLTSSRVSSRQANMRHQ
jgi:hypothetical protein